MRLISCNVAQFGKIKDFRYDFSQGLNPIIEENGWGKTTFSVFIKAMFYGLEYSPTKKKLLERNHYLPWDGGVCGGSIVFSLKDKTYRIERTFGKTDKDDTFKLFDENTGLESKDFSDMIGEEIFKVDRESFEKSVYIPQAAITTAMTDSLNAKMGNLATAKDDISNFDVALKSVKDAKGEYTRNSKINPGKLNAVKQEINKCKEDLEKLPGILEGSDALTTIIQEKHKALNELKAQKNDVVEKIQAQSKKEQELGAYRAYLENLKEEKAKLAELDIFFASGKPEKDELEMLEQTDRDLSVHQRAYDSIVDAQKHGSGVFTKPFEDRLPDEEEFSEWNKMAANLSELRAKAEHAKLSDEAGKQLAELKFFFDKKVPTEDELSNIEKKTTQVASLDGMISQANERLMTLKITGEAEKKHRDKKRFGVGTIIAVALGIVFLVTGIIFNNYNDNGLGLLVEQVAFAAAILDLLFIFIYHRGSSSGRNKMDEKLEDSLAAAEQELQDLKDQRAELVEECSEFLSYFLLTRAETMLENVYEIRRKLDQYQHLLKEEKACNEATAGTLDQLADLQLELYTKIQPFASAYGINLYEVGGEFDFLNQLKKDADRYSNYLLEEEKKSRHKNTIETMSADIQAVLNRYPVDREASRSDQIHEIGEKLRRYNSIQEHADSLQANIKAIEERYGVESNPLSVDELQTKQNELDSKIINLTNQLHQDMENAAKYSEEIERLSDIQEQIERLEAQETEYKAKAQLLEQTAEFLQKARESFLAKYMQPLQEGLHKYLSMIDSPEGTTSGYAISDFELDMDLNIRLDYSGSSKSADYLSQGYQDLVALCSRLALVDVLYSDEKPLLILDDPFTNFDDKKIKEALKLLEQISKERQIIYFTCHESRV